MHVVAMQQFPFHHLSHVTIKIQFYSILFYSILFYLFYSILFLFYSILFK